jgi:hypothetical protein
MNESSLLLSFCLMLFTHIQCSFISSCISSYIYTKIPRQEGIKTIGTYLLNDLTLKERTKLPVYIIIELLQMSTSMAYFIWKDTYYEQTNGLPIGSSTSDPLAQGYMEPYKHKAVTHYNTQNPSNSTVDTLQCWYWQVDDTFTSIHEDHIVLFHTWLNNLHLDIQWTYESEKEGRLNMLDLMVIHAPNGSLSFKKAWHT